MRELMVPVVAVLWGGAIVVSGFVTGLPFRDGAYAAGHFVAFAFAGLLLVAGAWTLIKRGRS